MPGPTEDELRERIAALEAENAELRRDSARTTDDERAKPRRGWGWTLLAVVLIVLGAVLAPVAVVASWARVQLTDTDAFVATFAPLAKDPAVQNFVTDQTMTVIQDKVNIPQLTSQVVDGITKLGTGPVATKALDGLKAPIALGIVNLLHSTVGDFVSSSAFAQVWEQALRASHDQLTATMQNSSNAAVKVGSNGSIGIQLGPIVDRVKQLLVARGLTFASQIPSVNRTVTIAQSSSIPTLQLYYGLAVAAGTWLPWVSLGLLALGVVVARRRALTLVWAAVALALAMAVVIVAISIGHVLFVGSVSPSLIPAGVAETVYSTVTTAMVDTAIAVLVLGIVVAVVGWYAGPFAVPRRLRGFFGAGVGRLRTAAEEHGITTGRAGEWMYAQRVLLRAVVAVIAAAVVLLVRPLTPSLIVWTLVIAALVIGVLELVERPAVVLPAEVDEDTPVMTVS